VRGCEAVMMELRFKVGLNPRRGWIWGLSPEGGENCFCDFSGARGKGRVSVSVSVRLK
jgi:hypothetical protein